MDTRKTSNAVPNGVSTFLGLRHLVSALRFSWDGIVACLKSEIAFRQEVFVAVANLIAVLVLPLGLELRLLMIALSIIVICVELINSAVEATVDLVTMERHPLAKKAKDVCSAAVFFAVTLFLGCWIAIIVKLCNG